MKSFRRLGIIIITLAVLLFSSACNNVKKFHVSFDTVGGLPTIETQIVKEGELAIEPSITPEKADFNFQFWSLDGEEFLFTTPIVKDIKLVATWQNLTESQIQADIEVVKNNLLAETYLLNMPRWGSIHRSSIVWKLESPDVMPSGIILPPKKGEGEKNISITASFTLNDITVDESFIITVPPLDDVVLENEKTLSFRNLTTEYTVENKDITLLYEKDGSVPYVKVRDFFDLLKGFIDPSVEIDFTTEAGKLVISYQYYDEEEDHTYDLINTIDTVNNTITTNDPGFYWAYVYSTETNYGRHIFYDRNHADKSEIEGSDVIYELSNYNLQAVLHEGDVYLPYFLANQLYAGSSYYNVYYNNDELLGIYSLPSKGTTEYRTIRRSSANNTKIPIDTVLHNYDMFAFNLDYFYGLKDYFDIDTYYNILEMNQANLLTNDAEKLDSAISKVLLQDIDEPHTSYGYPSYYNQRTWDGPPTNSLEVYGPRFQAWYYKGFLDVNDAIEAKWGRVELEPNQWAAGSKSRPKYWFLDDTHAVLILDGFVTADIEESSLYDQTMLEKQTEINDITPLMPQINEGNKFFYYKNSTRTSMKVELLVKGVTPSYVETYAQNLVDLGYERITATEETQEDKAHGYFKKTIDDTDYMLQVKYDPYYELFYVGIMDQAPANVEAPWPFTANIEELVFSDSAVYMEMTLEKIMSEKPGVTSITLDVTWNTGGNVGALYRVLGFITDQPFRVSSIDGSTKGASSSFVYIDGVPKYNHLTWSLLTSPLTFSAGNQLATIFKENKLGIIMGLTSGGGASSITPVLLPNGTAFTMSSNNISAFRRGDTEYTYEPNELGVEPDHVIDIRKIYDVETLLDILTKP